ncbi:MAG: formate C-acetyltransferase/glycerol dehydratase family glycyl radical enzyme, partial [Bacteroidales bacterium]|nr:formate C-acetyltransferase/glycerol dehydratase family glycyl radical enzyme [Bacteroidales bacterium]
MNERIKKLRENSLKAINKLSPERALLITEFYKSNVAYEVSTPVRRALSFEYIMKNKALYIGEGELIVGERGPAPKETPTYPEVSLHSIQDLEILDSRPKVSFKVDEKTKEIYRDIIIPYWKGKNNRDKIMRAMSPEWLTAYEAGVFTEFQEQRAPGHTVAGNKIYQKGMLDFINEINESIKNLDFINDSQAFDKREQLSAMKVSAYALIMWAERYAIYLESLAIKENDISRKSELENLAGICRKVPANAPETFHEAIQHYWFIHLGVVTELNPWDSFNPGRLDQHLYPFYKKETENGSLTKEKAVELLQSFWIKFNNHPAPPKVGITALESNTYTDFSLINVGGIKEDGSDASNEMTYIILDVIEEMRLLQPSSMVQLSKKNPNKLIDRAVKIIKTGYGQPSIFNTDAIIQELLFQGKDIIDARNGGASGCIETGAFGKEAYFLTGYFNFSKILELTLNNGFDHRTNKQVGLKTGNANNFTSYDELLAAYKKQLEYFIDIKIKGNNVIERIFSNNLPVPFLSLIIDDCITNGKDYNSGGAKYNTSYIQGVGTGTVTDGLSAIKHHIFEQNNFSMKELLTALSKDFIGYDDIHFKLIYESPKYGNDDDRADAVLDDVFRIFYNAVNGKPNTRGGVHRINLLPTTSHIYFGMVCGALPDGKKAGKPVSEGISPVQGADKNGPSAVIRSASKIDHLRTGGTL